MKKIIGLIATAAAVTMAFSGCSMLSGSSTDENNQLKNYDFTQMELIQLEEPQEGQTMAVIKTSLGEIKAVLYPELCPNTVQNFINRAKEGYYDNTTVFGMYQNNYFITGSNSEDGSTGRTDDGNPILNECSVKLWPFKGSLIAYSATQGYGDSRFMVANEVEITDEELEEIRNMKDDAGNAVIPEELLTAFKEKGALPGFSGSFTVFGQTIEGMDVIDKIIAVGADEETNKPLEKITIESITITEYHAD